MIPTVTAVRMTGARDRAELPLLVLGPALGVSATTLWWDCAQHLTDAFDVLAWDLPGHGHNRSVPEEPFTMAELAAGVLVVVEDVLAQREESGGSFSFSYAGAGLGGAVGLQLLLDAPGRLRAAVLLGTDGRGRPTPGASGSSYAGQALAAWDVLDRLGEVVAPVLAVAGAHDDAPSPQQVTALAASVLDGRFHLLDGVAQRAPAESAGAVAALVRHHVLGEADPSAAHAATAAGLEGDLEQVAARVRGALAGGVGAEEVRTLLGEAVRRAGAHDDPDAPLDPAFRLVWTTLEQHLHTPDGA